MDKKFKEILLQEYDGKCVFCGFNDEDYLTGAHIVPYSIMRKEDVQNAMHPSDGLLLCKLCDIAFENGDISINENYEIHVTEKLENSTNTTVTSWLSKINNKIPINKNSRYNPDPKYLKWELDLISY